MTLHPPSVLMFFWFRFFFVGIGFEHLVAAVSCVIFLTLRDNVHTSASTIILCRNERVHVACLLVSWII